MNGRIFDPVLARFLSVDPNIDGVSDSQGYNRYSYVLNNPLNATDPTGYLTLREVIPAIVAVVVTVVVTVYAGPAAGVKSGTSFFGMVSGAAAGTTGCATAVVVGAAAGGFASGFSGSLLNGGSIGDAFKSGLIGGATGAFTAWASIGIGGFWGHNPGEFDIFRELGRAMSHGLVGGAVSEATGGEFRHGFYSSGASSMFGHSPLGKRLMSSNLIVSTAASMAVGGTVSVLGGGKFANGAVTSAFQHLFNQAADTAEPKYTVEESEVGTEVKVPDSADIYTSDPDSVGLATTSGPNTRAIRLVTSPNSLDKQFTLSSPFAMDFHSSTSLEDSNSLCLRVGPSGLAGKPSDLVGADHQVWKNLTPGEVIYLNSCFSSKIAPLLVERYGVTVYASNGYSAFAWNRSGLRIQAQSSHPVHGPLQYEAKIIKYAPGQKK